MAQTPPQVCARPHFWPLNSKNDKHNSTIMTLKMTTSNMLTEKSSLSTALSWTRSLNVQSNITQSQLDIWKISPTLPQMKFRKRSHEGWGKAVWGAQLALRDTFLTKWEYSLWGRKRKNPEEMENAVRSAKYIEILLILCLLLPSNFFYIINKNSITSNSKMMLELLNFRNDLFELIMTIHHWSISIKLLELANEKKSYWIITNEENGIILITIYTFAIFGQLYSDITDDQYSLVYNFQRRIMDLEWLLPEQIDKILRLC